VVKAAMKRKEMKDRKQMWRKLLTGRNGRGCRVLLANELASMWQSLLNCQAGLAIMTVSMADIFLMLQRGETPKCGKSSPRVLTHAELVAIGDWYDSEVEHRGVRHALFGAQIGKRAPNYTFNEKRILAAAQACESCTQCEMSLTAAHFWPLDWRHRTRKDASIKCAECCPKPPDELKGYLARRAQNYSRAPAKPITCQICERSLTRSQFRKEPRGKYSVRKAMTCEQCRAEGKLPTPGWKKRRERQALLQEGSQAYLERVFERPTSREGSQDHQDSSSSTDKEGIKLEEVSEEVSV
jgi:hypothetical protein